MSFEKTQCPKCGTAFRYAPEHLGSKTRCKNCQTVFVISRPQAKPQAKPAKPQTKPAPASPVAAKPVAQPVKAVPVQAKPAAQANPVAKPVKAAVAKPAVAKPVSAQPVTAKPVKAATPVTAKPVKAAPSAKPALRPAKPAGNEAPVAAEAAPVVAATAVSAKPQPDKAKEASPYEAFVEEAMTGSASPAATNKVATLPQGTASSYLSTNKKLNQGIKRKDGDWATTFIFRGTNLALFGMLLYGIAMLGIGSLFAPLTSPICVCIAVALGMIGSIMVMVGFVTKPGAAALCGLIPAVLFLGAGGWAFYLYTGGHWDFSSHSMAAVTDHHQEIADNPELADDYHRRHQARIKKNKFSSPSPSFRPPTNLSSRQQNRSNNLSSRNRSSNQRRSSTSPNNDPFGAKAEFDRIEKEAQRQLQDSKRRSDEIRKEMDRRIKQAIDDPFVPVAPITSPGNRNASTPRTMPANSPPKNTFDGWDTVENKKPDVPSQSNAGGRGNATPFADYRSNSSSSSRLRRDYTSNSRNRFGARSQIDFPAANLIGPVGKERNNRSGDAMIGKDGPLIGFLAIKDFSQEYCRTLLPVFDPNDKASSVAKDGYALGGLEVELEGEKLVAIRAIYMKVNGKKLDTADRYFGEWIGSTPSGKPLSVETAGPVPIGFRTQGLGKVQNIALIID